MCVGGGRVCIPKTMVLTSTAYKMVVASKLPPVAYLTFTDQFILWNYLIIIAFAIESGPRAHALPALAVTLATGAFTIHSPHSCGVCTVCGGCRSRLTGLHLEEGLEDGAVFGWPTEPSTLANGTTADGGVGNANGEDVGVELGDTFFLKQVATHRSRRPLQTCRRHR